MHILKLRIQAVAIALIIVAAATPAANGQQVHVVPNPDHPDPHSIYLASARLSVDIRGGVAHTTLTQVFSNPNDWRAEGIYLFPLPEGAAVTDFRLTMDGKAVRGEVLDREKARRIYMDIVRRIRDPALLEWMNNKVFQARIFPFEPNGERKLELSYAQVLPQEGDYRVFRYLTGQGRTEGRPPMIVRRDPRIVPGIQPVPETPPRVSAEYVTGQIRRPASFVVEGTIRDDHPIRTVYSPTHPLSVEHGAEGIFTEFTAEGSLYSREGFTLYYGTGERTGIGMSLLTHRPPGEDGFFLVTINPGEMRRHNTLPRDIIFVLDTSGSMRGDGKLQQAVEALDYGLSTLGTQDRFALVIYNSSVRAWRDDLTPVDRNSVSQARDFIRSLSAGGGTNIEGALSASADFASESVEENGRNSHLTYVVFLTDGLPTVGVTEPDELLEQSSDDLPEEVRLFTWGVGYDVNAFLLDRLAGEHGGQSAYVEPNEDLEVKVSAFFKSVSTPMLADLEFEIAGADIYDLFPAELPDLFEGSQITVMGRYSGSGRAELRLAGRMGDRIHTVRHSVTLPRRHSEAFFLAPMWAQRKVGFLIEEIRLHGESEELKQEIIELGERYGIVTPYTAYLVIEAHMRRAEEDEAMAFATPAAQASARIAREAITARTRPDASLYGGRAGSQKQTGQADIQLSVAEQNLQRSTIYNQLDYLKVQRIGEKTFQLDEEKGIWRDQALRDNTSFIEVEIGTEKFMKLLERYESLARYAAVGEQVELLLDGQGYRLVLP